MITSSPLQTVLYKLRTQATTEREQGTSFEQLVLDYLRNEPTYKNLYAKVQFYADWAKEQGLQRTDTGIDLVAQTAISKEFHAIQCKFFATDHHLQKKDIDSFFTASGKKPFVHRLIVTTTELWSKHAQEALLKQQIPVTRLGVLDLENSRIDWSQYQFGQTPKLKLKKVPRPHQISAINAVIKGLTTAERGKLIMACGTGKTFTSLKIAEQLAVNNRLVLFLVPSLALMSQVLTEWNQESSIKLCCFAVCSDNDVGKKRQNEDDLVTEVSELNYPATTNGESLARALLKAVNSQETMSVVFSTYHSIAVINAAQKQFNIPAFDLIICDEAHRTTGQAEAGKEESHFVKVHNNDFITAHRRLYMTATPRIYGEKAKDGAKQDNIILYSMDDTELYGEDLYTINFSNAVKLKLLVDYKVVVLAMDEEYVGRRIQKLLSEKDSQLKVEDATRIVGCWKALTKQDLRSDLGDDLAPMQRAVAFCQVIEPSTKGKTHKVSSKYIASMFQKVVDEYLANETGKKIALTCETNHIDGAMNASEKSEKLTWLRAEIPAKTCRILSNVRCLSEGVDVPALDAILFLSPRNSQVDVVQAVGRVMRIAPGKKRGYVILPVVIPAGMEPHEALDDNKVYAVVWQVLQALRAHDDKFDAIINKLDLLEQIPSTIEVISISDKIYTKPQDAGKNKLSGRNEYNLASNRENNLGLQFTIGELERAIYAKIVKKCGNRQHWEEWAEDIGNIAQQHIQHIRAILADVNNRDAIAAFNKFVQTLKLDLSVRVTDEEIIEMLAQHLITKPVFAALFGSYDFAAHNPVSKAMQWVLNTLEKHGLNQAISSLQGFYASVQQRADEIDNAAAKQRIIIELYDKFFKTAFPRLTERLGIVYTPIEVVDFILHSVNHLLQTEFNETLSSSGVHILDPFTGTGTFMTRLLQSGLINQEQLPYKYANELHANEIVLLAYYIAAINIESTYHDTLHPCGGGQGEGYKNNIDPITPHPNLPPQGGKEQTNYHPFPGICLTDTFALFERKDLITGLMNDNAARIQQQKQLTIQVIIGNPPYSAGQKSANDNNQNSDYIDLDERIEKTYAKRSKMTSVKNLYDSYIRAIRWASDRIKDRGIIGFVTNAGFIDSNSADGLRQCLAEEFSSIYVLHLRGNQRTAGELSRKEGGKIFGSGSRAPIAISLLIKNPQSKQHGQIYFYDIGDYLTREEKLTKLNDFHSIAGITNWHTVIPDQHGDWLQQRQDDFAEFIVLGDKKGNTLKLFENFSQGILTARDTWCYNASKNAVAANMQRMIEFYNSEVMRFANAFAQTDKKTREAQVNEFINSDATQISWSSSLIPKLISSNKGIFDKNKIVISLYRPFQKQWLYYDGMFNHRVGQMPRLFPNATVKNRVICVNGIGAKDFSVLISNQLPDFNMLAAGAQCFSLYLYDEVPIEVGTDFFNTTSQKTQINRKDAITEAGLLHFQAAYTPAKINKEDVFYYVYGLLHSPLYRQQYQDNLSKELPRIPRVANVNDFWAFSQAGRELAELHVNYEQVPMYAVQINGKELNVVWNSIKNYRVQKMRYGKIGKDKDLTTIVYNEHITITGIPIEAYEYVVNGKTAIDWVMERQSVRTDKDSGIVNDANTWAIETMNNPRYPLELLLRVITVSVETMKIVQGLPKIDGYGEKLW